MKKLLLILLVLTMSAGYSWSQCVTTCSSYVTFPITYTTFPSAGTNAISQFAPNTDDGITPLLSIGFNFNFYCTSYSQLRICSNGFIQFNNGVPAVSTGFADPTQAFPDVTAPNALVALDMNDLDASGAGPVITYTTVGTTPNQMFIVTYSNVPIFGYANSPHTGQIVLYETSNIIEIHTGTVTNQSTTYGTQGIENANGTAGTPVPGRNNVIWNSTNTAYRFIPVTPTPPATISGNTLVCEGTQNGYFSLPANGATSYTWSLPAGWMGTSTTTALTATAGVSGNVSVAATYTCGTSASTTLSVLVNPAPVVSIQLTDPYFVCEGTTFTITASGASNYSVLPGPDNGASPIVVTNTGSTTYTVIGSDSYGCLSVNVATTQIESQATPTVTVNSGSICVGQTFTMSPSGANSYVSTSGFLNVTPNTAGVFSYSVTGIGTGNNTCPSQVPAVSTLTVNSNPTVDITTPRTTICKNETITLTGTGAATYLWSNNQTSTSIMVSPATVGIYSVTGTSAQGCTGTKVITIIVSECLGINEVSNTTGLVSVYPNPSTGAFSIKFENATGLKELEIYNALGQLVQAHKTDVSNLQVDLTTQPNGLYYLKLKGSEKSVVKVIKD